MRFPRVAGWVGLLISLLPACAEEELCAGCELRLSPQLTIRGDEQRAAMLVSTKLHRAADGRYYAAPLANPAAVGIFGPRGEFQGLVGSAGGGPGEIRRVEGVTTWGDSLVVFDGTGEVELFDRASRFVRSFPLPARPGGLVELAPGLLAGGLFGVPQPLLVRRTGEMLTPITRASSQLDLISRFIARSPGGAVWMVRGDLALDSVAADGSLRRTMTGNLTNIAPQPIRGDPRYSARVTDAIAPTDDRLVVLIARRDLHWRRSASAKMPAGESQPGMLTVPEVLELNRFFVAVVDLRRRKLLVMRTLDRFPAGLLDDGSLVTIEPDGDFGLALRIWRMRISGTPS